MSKIVKPYKKKAYEEAKSLRMKGFSYTEIAKICLISRGTIANWFSKESFSVAVTENNKQRAYKENVKKMQLLNKSRKNIKTAHYQDILKSAEVEFKHYKNSPLFVAGLSVYKLAGDGKHPNVIRLSSRNSEAHQVFIKFVGDFLGIEKKDINFWFSFYKNQDETKLMKFWSRKTGLSIGRFYKNQELSRENKGKTLHFGVGNTIIGSTVAKKKLLLWQNLIIKEVLQ